VLGTFSVHIEYIPVNDREEATHPSALDAAKDDMDLDLMCVERQ